MALDGVADLRLIHAKHTSNRFDLFWFTRTANSAWTTNISMNQILKHQTIEMNEIN